MTHDDYIAEDTRHRMVLRFLFHQAIAAVCYVIALCLIWPKPVTLIPIAVYGSQTWTNGGHVIFRDNVFVEAVGDVTNHIFYFQGNQ